MEYELILKLDFLFVLFAIVFSVIMLFKMKDIMTSAQNEFERKHPSFYTEYATFMYDCTAALHHNIALYFLWYLVYMICLGIFFPYYTGLSGIVVTLFMTAYCMGVHRGVETSVSALTVRALARIHLAELAKKIKKNEDLLLLE